MRPPTPKLLVGLFLVFLLLPSVISAIPVHATSPTKVTIGPNVDISILPGPQAETGIAINPKNPSQIVAVSTDYPGPGSGFGLFGLFGSGKIRAYFSSDGGVTWGSTLLPVPPSTNSSGMPHIFDEGVAWDTLGNAYVSYQIWFQNAKAVLAAEMAVARSSNAGHTWNSTYFDFTPGFGALPEKTLIAMTLTPQAHSATPSTLAML